MKAHLFIMTVGLASYGVTLWITGDKHSALVSLIFGVAFSGVSVFHQSRDR